ncbi:hypothetical protein Bbelb_437180 [Branchiostoma belcheri]|nr:hypothetical protein Bbelb_437180 [Branchiostoma belcheri]
MPRPPPPHPRTTPASPPRHPRVPTSPESRAPPAGRRGGPGDGVVTALRGRHRGGRGDLECRLCKTVPSRAAKHFQGLLPKNIGAVTGIHTESRGLVRMSTTNQLQVFSPGSIIVQFVYTCTTTRQIGTGLHIHTFF